MTMGCNSPGATHHLACDCRERELAERLAGADRALFAERERVVRAELRAASLSQELLAAEKAREEADAYAGRANARIADLGERLDATEAVLRAAESRAASLSQELDTIEGWATGQPGKMPTAVEDGWSTALSAAVARVTAAESRAARLLTALKEIESKTGHFGEAPPPPEWMPLLSLIAWVGRTARAALAAEEGK
jgi:DNA primase large subunit